MAGRQSPCLCGFPHGACQMGSGIAALVVALPRRLRLRLFSEREIVDDQHEAKLIALAAQGLDIQAAVNVRAKLAA
jgi:hypothetical protein